MEFIVVRDDIVRSGSDAIVLPANSKLRKGSGASTAIYEAAGKERLAAACGRIIRKRKSIEAGHSVYTLGFDISDFIIHTVVPTWVDGEHDEWRLLSEAYISALSCADLLGCKSVSFPLLSAGNNGFDPEIAYQIAKESITIFTPKKDLRDVVLVVYGVQDTDMIKSLGVDVDERIDEKYVLEQEEKHYGKGVLAYLQARRAAKKAAGTAIDVGGKFVEDLLEDPEFRKNILNAALQAEKKALQYVVDAIPMIKEDSPGEADNKPTKKAKN